jgi:MFS family permease
MSLYHLPRLTELPRLFTTHALTTFARGAGAIFIPIYLYKLGYSIEAILVLFIVQYMCEVPVRLASPKLIQKFGSNHAIAFGCVMNIIYYLLLATLKTEHWPLLLLSISGSFLSIYWMGFHPVFARELLHRKSGRIVGILNAMVLVISALAPAIGGLVATLAGAKILYFMVVAIYAVAGIIIVIGKEPYRSHTFSLSSIKFKTIRRDLFANSCYGVINNGIEGLVWPMFLYLLIPSFVAIGVLTSLVTIVSSAISLYVGSGEEKHGVAGYMRTGIGFYATSNVGRLIAWSLFSVFGANFTSGIGRAFMQTSYSTRYYENASSYPSLEYVSVMESAISLGMAFFYTILLIGAAFVDIKSILIFGLITSLPISMGVTLIKKSSFHQKLDLRTL